MVDPHPLLVHFPSALIPLALVFGLWTLIQRRIHPVRNSYRLILALALLFTLLTYLSGDRAGDTASGRVPHELLESHERLGTMTLWLVCGAALVEGIAMLRRLRTGDSLTLALSFLLVVSATITAALAGHRGARLVYEYGGGVGRVFGPAVNVTVEPAPGARAPDSGYTATENGD